MNTSRKAIAFGQYRTAIRSTGLIKINRLVRAARHLPELLEAFAEWSAGEIYVCKKTATYRYRFGERSKSVTPWSSIAVGLFQSSAEFAFAAAVFHEEPPQSEADGLPASDTRAACGTRVNVFKIAHAA